MQSYVDSAGALQREFFMAETDRANLDAMDARREQLVKEGATQFHRTKIGRNATCPCGSGRKFKKCCITAAQRVGRR